MRGRSRCNEQPGVPLRAALLLERAGRGRRVRDQQRAEAALAHPRALVSRQHSLSVCHAAQPPPKCFSQMQGATSAQPSMRLPPSAARDAAPGADLAHRGQNSTCSYAWMRCCSWPPWYFSMPFIRTKDRAFGGHGCGWRVAVLHHSSLGTATCHTTALHGPFRPPQPCSTDTSD